MVKLPYYLGSADDGVDRRAMVSLGPVSEARYCHFDCKFCYVHGPFPRYQKASPDEIIEWLLENRGRFDIIYVSGDTDSFAFKRSKEAIRLLRLISENLDALDCDVLFTTRYVFTDEENSQLEEIAEAVRKQGKLLIGCVSVCQLYHRELEPAPVPLPHDRIDQLGVWKKLGLSTVLAIRPFIPGVPISELSQIASQGVRFADVIIGGNLYVDQSGEIQSRLSQVFENWNVNSFETQQKPLDFSHSNEIWTEVESNDAAIELRRVCRQLGKPFHMRSTPAVQHFRNNRDYYLGNNNQRMFAANIMAAISIQMSIANRHLEEEKDFWGQREKGFKEFVGSYIKRRDIHAKLADPDRVMANHRQSMIDGNDNLFQGAFKMLQEELETLFLNTFGGKEIASDDATKIVLYGSPTQVGGMYGSVPAGWDAMVKMKRELLTRNQMRSARARWLLALMADVEKNLRDMVCTSILNMGSNPQFRAAIKTTNEAYFATEENLNEPSKLRKISEDFSIFMAKDAENTFRASRVFFKALKPTKDTQLLRSVGHMRDALQELGTNRVQTIERLLSFRKAALHDSEIQDFFPHKSFVQASPFDEVTEWTVERCELIVQFLLCFCVECALASISALVLDHNESAIEIAPLIRKKATSEFRVHSLTLLKSKSFWLAYFFAEAADYFFEDDDGIMLKLNAAYAFKKIADRTDSPFVFSEDDVPRPDQNTSWHPKHVLIRMSLLEETAGLREVMLDAADDMSIAEFRTWPALEYIRNSEVFLNSLKEIEDLKLDSALSE